MRDGLKPSEVCVVEDIGVESVRVRCFKEPHDELLRDLGGRKHKVGDHWDLPYGSDEELARLLMALRDAGFALVGTPGGWPPTAIFQDLRKQGLVDGPYLEITWRGPGDPILLKHSR